MVAASADEVIARVVIVDESPDSREVLHTLLENRGVMSVEVSEPRAGLEMLHKYHPSVLVLDRDSAAGDVQLQVELQSAAREHETALVVLGKARGYLDCLPDGQVIAKPYHYGPLLRTIERLLAR